MQPDYAKNAGKSELSAVFLSESGLFQALTSVALKRRNPDEQPFCNADKLWLPTKGTFCKIFLDNELRSFFCGAFLGLALRSRTN